MNAKSFRKMLVLAVALVCVSAGLVRADKLELQASLAKNVKIKLEEVTIAEALEKIGEKAGVEFVLSDEAMWKLPHGEGTRLSVELEGPLAESLTNMLNAFFMRYVVGDSVITIYPRPELEHFIGRPSEKGLRLLRRIYDMPIATYVENPQHTMNEVLKEYVALTPYPAQQRIDYILHNLAGKKKEKPRPEELEFKLPGPMTVANILEQSRLASGGEEEWYLAGGEWPDRVPEIRVVDVKAFREAKLDQIVDISFKDEEALVILQRLAKWAGMELVVEKKETSWLDDIISVDMQNIKLRQAMRNIVTTVDGDISFDIGDNEIGIVGPMHREKVTALRRRQAARGPTRVSGPPAVGDEYVGKISIPMDGGKYYIEFMLRESDLTEELRQLRADKMKEILGDLPKSEQESPERAVETQPRPPGSR